MAFVASDPQNKSSNSSLLILKALTDKAQWNCRGIFRESISILWMWLWIDRTSVASGMKEGGPGSRPCTPTRQTSIPIKRERYSACSHFLPPPFFSTHFTCYDPWGVISTHTSQAEALQAVRATEDDRRSSDGTRLLKGTDTKH